MNDDLLGSVHEEFANADIPDWRLRERLPLIAEALDQKPESSLPKALTTKAAREAAYRFLGNRNVTAHRILTPHQAATARRCAAARAVYVISDTTECSFSGEERGKKLGRLQGNSRGFLAHMALAVAADGTRRPLGILGLDVLTREDSPKRHRNVYQQKKDPRRESLKWSRMVDTVAGDLPPDVHAIHVMDSEADIFELLSAMQDTGRKYIIRAGQNRRVAGGLLNEAVQTAQVVLSREVRLSRRAPTGVRRSRRNPLREGRLAALDVSSLRVQLRRPKTCTAPYPAELTVNVVHVRERGAPEGEQPVEWILFTSEPIHTDAQIGAVIDGYRCRWLIEEYFKALKTGCKYEERELESLRTLTNFLAICSVLAWRLLLLRSVHRQNSEAPATDVVAAEMLDALAARLKHLGHRKPLPSSPTVADLMDGIARLGGHIESNGAPGWQVLWRGYQDLLSWGGGFIAKSHTYSDQS